jgi:hypothetical protein
MVISIRGVIFLVGAEPISEVPASSVSSLNDSPCRVTAFVGSDSQHTDDPCSLWFSQTLVGSSVAKLRLGIRGRIRTYLRTDVMPTYTKRAPRDCFRGCGVLEVHGAFPRAR